MQFSVRVIFALALGAGLVGVAAADSFGAIAYSPGSGAYGYSYDYDTEYEAVMSALQSCGRNDCVSAITFWDGGCGAVAAGSDGGWGSSGGYDEGNAVRSALQACRQYSQNCEVVASACTS